MRKAFRWHRELSGHVGRGLKWYQIIKKYITIMKKVETKSMWNVTKGGSY